MDTIKRTCFASVVSISEILQSDIYLTVKARLFETPGANINGVRVTEAFLDEIVANEDKYIGLPLCADVKNLANGNYKQLGHLYDQRTGEFHSTQIGSFYKFEKEETKDGAALIGYARIMKRNKAICKAIAELFMDGSLKFSFEITCGKFTELEDDTIEIDVDGSNFLEGVAVVSFPACENAVALELVAECTGIHTNNEEGENAMPDETKVAEVKTEVADHIPDTATAEVAEATAPAENTEVAEVADPATAEAQTSEIAQTYKTESKTEVEETREYDTDTGEEKSTRTVKEESHSSVAEIAEKKEEEPSDPEDPEEPDEPEDKEDEEQAQCKKKAEIDSSKTIAELTAAIEALRVEIAEMKKAKETTVVAEAASKQPNPFVSEINVDKVKYTLLESAKETPTFSLLDKA